jgi:putative transposase
LLRKKNIWLSKNSMQKILKNRNLHSQTTQGIIDVLYDNIDSWRQKRKNGDINCRLPKKRRWYFNIIYKKSAIRLKNNKLILSNGKGNKPLEIEWNFNIPKMIKISFNKVKMCYQINAIYDITPLENNNDNFAGIDLGEIHIAVVNTGKNTYIINGRKLRSKRRYQNKAKAKLEYLLSKKQRGSKRRKKLVKKKNKILTNLNNQIKDICQKQTTKLVSLLNKDKVKTVGIGDLTGIRNNIDYSKKVNQKLHQWNFSQITQMITYKSEKLGMIVKKISERHTSQTCPICLLRHKPSNRNYKCKCGFKFHRDGVGAINIRSRTKYQELVPVVGAMTSPIGIRY